MNYVVDVQGFRRSSNIFIEKEVAILAIEEDATPTVLNFQPPCSWSKLLAEEQDVNRWLELNFHGMPWSSGTIPHTDVIKVIQNSLSNANKIYVKGLEKVIWLRKILYEKEIINMNDIGCPKLEDIVIDYSSLCTNHPLAWRAKCAVKNALALSTWLRKNVEKNYNVVCVSRKNNCIVS